jgi:hypothetical protein
LAQLSYPDESSNRQPELSKRGHFVNEYLPAADGGVRGAGPERTGERSLAPTLCDADMKA